MNNGGTRDHHSSILPLPHSDTVPDTGCQRSIHLSDCVGKQFLFSFSFKTWRTWGKEILSKLSRVAQVKKYDLNSGLSISKSRVS